jgi:hypothetical protein
MDMLIDALNSANLIDDQNRIILKRYPDGSFQCVDKEVFSSMFGSALSDLNGRSVYEALLAADVDPETGSPRGYTRFFQEWHQLGLI